MFARAPEDSTEQRLLLHRWRHVIAAQAVVTLLMLPMLRLHPGLTLAATAFNLLALANTIHIHRNRARTVGQAPTTTGRDLATVAACIVGTALCAVALAVWPR